MASKYRPKGSYKDLLNLDASQISAMSDAQLRGVVEKLNDVANKRIQRLKKAGLEELSPALRLRVASGKEAFTNPRTVTKSELRTLYMKARVFLAPTGTSTASGVLEYNKRFEGIYKDILGRDFNDAENFDKRYKRKKVLKKSVKKRIRDFWEKYDEFTEIAKAKYPDYFKGDTDMSLVQKFEEEVYSKGKTSLSEMESFARSGYEQEEGDSNEVASVPTATPYRQRKGIASKTKSAKPRKSKEFEVKVRFEEIKIL